jgi:hypothetical protein
MNTPTPAGIRAVPTLPIDQISASPSNPKSPKRSANPDPTSTAACFNPRLAESDGKGWKG